MELITTGIEEKLLECCKGASAAHIAVAYFNPPDRVLEALGSISSLSIVVSGDYAVNNPYKLEALAATGAVRQIPITSKRLHSKLYVFWRPDGSAYALFGSANLTYGGLVANSELLGRFDSRDEATPEVAMLDRAFGDDWNRAQEAIDWALWKKVYDARGPRGTALGQVPRAGRTTSSEQRLWFIKTGLVDEREDHWYNWVLEGVVALGWDVGRDPSKLSPDKLTALVAANPHVRRKPKALPSVRTMIRQFWTEIRDGDVLIIISGYPPNQGRDVFFYGVAVATGVGAFYDQHSTWSWTSKRHAHILPIERHIPVSILKDTLRGSSLSAIEPLSEPDARYERFRQALIRDLGIRLPAFSEIWNSGDIIRSSPWRSDSV